jgi:hypothetical protein
MTYKTNHFIIHLSLFKYSLSKYQEYFEKAFKIGIKHCLHFLDSDCS